MDEFYIGDLHPMYVQRWGEVQQGFGRIAILVHGGAHTGVCWTSCPDGRPGWARHLLDKGWTVFVVDWPGVGRSPRRDDFLSAGPTPVVEALVELLNITGPALLIGHSIGAAISVKVIDRVPDLVSGFLALNPAPPVSLERERPVVPEDRAVRFDEAAARKVFANAERFPNGAFKAYLRTLCDLSPSLFNAVGSTRYSNALSADQSRIRQIPALVIAGDADILAPESSSLAMAQYLGCEHILVGCDWRLEGFGHMIPIELGSEEILFRALVSFET